MSVISDPSRRRAYFWFGIAVSAISLIIAFSLVEWNELKSSLSQADYIWLVPSALVTFLALSARAERWRWLMGGQQYVSFGRSFRAISIGYLITNLFPFRLGELVRPLVIARGGKIRGMHSFSTIAVEHLLDLLMVLIMFSLVLYDVVLPDTAEKGALRAFVLFIITTAVLILMVWQRSRLERLASSIISRMPVIDNLKWIDRFSSFMQGLEIIRSTRMFFISLIWSVVSWLLSAAGFYFALKAFIPEAGLMTAFLVTIAATLARLAPATPGSIGVIQIVIQQSLTAYNISPSIGLAFGIVYHAVEFIVLNIAGVISVILEGMSWTSLVSTFHRAEK
ncbi:MAG: flippase-like domain-containing protein [Nitrospirota bacterium]|nr:MAG: flippase-like domain-containing protein [Nitrospirota bacterium]